MSTVVPAKAGTQKYVCGLRWGSDEVIEVCAEKVKDASLPMGHVEIRKRPTNQGSNFASDNWAKIYPSSEAPKELAYTAGIGADDGFVVKIDTAGLDGSNAARRAQPAFAAMLVVYFLLVFKPV